MFLFQFRTYYFSLLVVGHPWIHVWWYKLHQSINQSIYLSILWLYIQILAFGSLSMNINSRSPFPMVINDEGVQVPMHPLKSVSLSYLFIVLWWFAEYRPINKARHLEVACGDHLVTTQQSTRFTHHNCPLQSSKKMGACNGTWKSAPGKGDSFWKPSFSGSMLNFGGVSTKRIIHSNTEFEPRKEPGFLKDSPTCLVTHWTPLVSHAFSPLRLEHVTHAGPAVPSRWHGWCQIQFVMIKHRHLVNSHG